MNSKITKIFFVSVGIIAILGLLSYSNNEYLKSFISPIYGDPEIDCTQHSSEHLIQLLTVNVTGCNWLVDKLLYNSSNSTADRTWNVDHELLNIPFLGEDFYLDSSTIESWVLTR